MIKNLCPRMKKNGPCGKHLYEDVGFCKQHYKEKLKRIQKEEKYKIKFHKLSQEEYILENIEKNSKIYYIDNYKLIYSIIDGMMEVVGMGDIDTIS